MAGDSEGEAGAAGSKRGKAVAVVAACNVPCDNSTAMRERAVPEVKEGCAGTKVPRATVPAKENPRKDGHEKSEEMKR